MNTKITGKNFTLTDGIKEAVNEKVKKIEKVSGPEAAVDICLSVKEGKAKRAEVTVKADKNIVRAEVTGDDMYKLIAEAVDTVVKRIKKIKDKQRKRAGSESIREPEKNMEVTKEETAETFTISRSKAVHAESMTVDEACQEMEYTDHDFYIFRDADADDELCIVYKRKDGDFGVIEVNEPL